MHAGTRGSRFNSSSARLSPLSVPLEEWTHSQWSCTSAIGDVAHMGAASTHHSSNTDFVPVIYVKPRDADKREGVSKSVKHLSDGRFRATETLYPPEDA